jgi:hypothetical protein
MGTARRPTVRPFHTPVAELRNRDTGESGIRIGYPMRHVGALLGLVGRD